VKLRPPLLTPKPRASLLLPLPKLKRRLHLRAKKLRKLLNKKKRKLRRPNAWPRKRKSKSWQLAKPLKMGLTEMVYLKLWEERFTTLILRISPSAPSTTSGFCQCISRALSLVAKMTLKFYTCKYAPRPYNALLLLTPTFLTLERFLWLSKRHKKY
jgi:hypothetical protein